MKRGICFGLAVAAVCGAALLLGCGDEETTRPVCAPELTDTPEKVVEELITSYRRRHIACYREILHPDFRFYFQERHVPPDLGRDYWTAAEDSAGTHALFSTEVVTDISLDLTYHDAVAGTVERSPEPVMWIRVTPMKLTVDDRSGTTYLVTGDIQDLFFRRGAGADSTRWYLYEWHDIRGGGGIGSPDAGVEDAAVETMSWGWLKTLYR